LHQVGDLFELNVKLRCQKVKEREAWNGLMQKTQRHVGLLCQEEGEETKKNFFFW